MRWILLACFATVVNWSCVPVPGDPLPAAQPEMESSVSNDSPAQRACALLQPEGYAAVRGTVEQMHRLGAVPADCLYAGMDVYEQVYGSSTAAWGCVTAILEELDSLENQRD